MSDIGNKSLTDVELLAEVRKRRIWYNNIEIAPGKHTRFDSDLDANSVLEAVDSGNQDTVRWLESNLPSDLTGASVLDFGCADGLFAIWAARRGATRVVGVERNRPNAERAHWLSNALGFGNIEIIHGAMEDHLSTEQFDHVFCLGLLYHLVEPFSTLHKIRQCCRESLQIVTAIDIQGPEDAEPIARLDRYVTGAHGLWSFNAAFVRQSLATGGFEVCSDELQARPQGTRYLASCAPGPASEHHVFAKTLDQEFPINIDRRTKFVRARWSDLATRSPKAVAIFGAGTHTPWLLERVHDLPVLPIQCVLDDRPPSNKAVAYPARSNGKSIAIQDPSAADLSTIDAVLISSWHQTPAIEARAADLFKPHVSIVVLDPAQITER